MGECAVVKAGPGQKSDTQIARRPAPELVAETRLQRMQRSLGNRAFSRMVQTRLIVGPAGDLYEREADRVAEEVMGLHGGLEHTGEHIPEHADTLVQRACRTCDESIAHSDDQTQVRRLCRECESEEEAVRRVAQPHAPAGDPEMIDDRQLAQGGDPLPSSVRHFFEVRFARDFSEVRMHTGPVAASYNDVLHALAFTYGNHIWMGRGQTVHPSLLMAHELAHVVQQTRPRRIPSHGQPVPQGIHREPHGPLIRRFEPYWEPFDMSGQKNHDMVLPAMGKASTAFTEAPVADAKTGGTGNFGVLAEFGRVGQVDFYKASTTVGVYFHGHGKPVALTAGDVPHRISQNGVRFEHNTMSAPQVVGGKLVNSASGPKEIKIGDLKPSHGTLEAYVGQFQLAGYKRGFEHAHREANDLATPGDGKDWNPLSVSIMSPTDLTIPPDFVHPSFAGQTARELVIKQLGRKPLRPRTPVEGHLCVRPDTIPGIWNYTWVPTTKPAEAVLPGRIKALHPSLKTKIIDPLLTSPVAKKPKSKPGPRPQHAPPLTSELKPIVRRKETGAPEKDNFDYETWKKDRKEIGADLAKEEKTSEFKEAEEKILENRAHEAIREKFDLPLPEVTSGKEAGKTLGQLEFWTGIVAAPLGFFRKVFGTTFVKVAQFFIKLRDKVRDFLKKMRAKATVGTGFLGAALKAAFRGLKMVARFVIGKVVDRMMESLVTGVANKIKQVIGVENLEALEAKVEEVKAVADDLERKVTDTADQLLEKLFGVHLKDLEKLKEIYDIFNDIVTLISWVRWGARVVACLSPPAFGCLWILAEGALDWAAQKVAETCWFQEKIRPLLTAVKYVTTDLPNAIADGIIGKVKDLLPQSLKDIFADLQTGEVKPSDQDVECDEEDDKTRYEPSPLHNQIEELYKRLGPERAAALQLLASKLSVPKDQELTAEMLNQLGEQLSKVSPEQLQKYAESYPAGAAGVPADVSKFVEDLDKTGGAAGTPAAPPPSAPQPAAPTAPPGTGGPDDTTPLNKQQGTPGGTTDTTPQKPGEESKGGESGGMSVVDGRTRIIETTSTVDLPDVKGRVANPDWNHHTGDEPLIHVLVYWKGEARVLIRNIETKVGNRHWVPPEAKSEAEAVGMLIPYRTKHGYLISEIPNALIPKNIELKALLFTPQGEAALKKLRAEKAAESAKK